MGACGFTLLVKNAPGASAETHARLMQGLVGELALSEAVQFLKREQVYADWRQLRAYGVRAHWCRRRVRSGGDCGNLKPNYFSNLTVAYTSH